LLCLRFRHFLFETGMTDSMRTVELAAPGAADQLRLGRRPMPRPGAGELLIRVTASGVNRPDVLQRKGLYPPPPGASDILGWRLRAKS